jgi:Tfp pilus assembly pilus retraction ATPase PilT
MNLSDLMQLVFSERGDAIHLHEKERPVVEVNRVLVKLEGPPLALGETEEMLRSLASEEELEEFSTNQLACFYYHFRNVAVFQVMAFREDGHVRLELRRFR